MQQKNRVQDLLRSAIRNQARVELVGGDGDDAAFLIERGGDSARLVPTTPENASGAVGELILLNYAGDRELDRLRAKGSNFVDLAGHVHLILPFLVVEKERLHPTVETQRAGFSPSTEMVIHTVLASRSPGPWTTRSLAGEAGVSPATVSRSVRELRSLGLVVDSRPGARTRSEIRVPDRERLLLAWAERSHWSQNPRVDLMAPIGSVEKWLVDLGRHLDMRWALTLQSGAAFWAPHAHTEDLHLYVDVPEDRALRSVASRLDAIPSERGNLHLLRPRDPSTVWARIEPRDGIPIVEPHRLVVDLWHYPLRGREQAEHLIETVLRPRWERV